MKRLLILCLTSVAFAKDLGSSAMTKMDSEMSVEPEPTDAPGKTPFFHTDDVNTYCNKTFMIEPTAMEALEQSGSFPDETDKTPKCFVKCVLEMTGVSDDDGRYDPAQAALAFAGHLGETEIRDVENIAKDCAMNRAEKDICEVAYAFAKCVLETEMIKNGKIY